MFDKLDAYNLVANFVPGAALTYALHASGFPSPSPDSLGAFVLVSFVAGVITNRLGSLLVDPVLRSRRVHFLKPKNYQSYVSSEKADPKLETIVANAGLYRTFFTAGLVYLVLRAGNLAVAGFGLGGEAVFFVFVLVGMAVSIFALRKEDDYISVRMGRGEP